MDGARTLYLNRHPWRCSVHGLYCGSEQWGGSHRKCLVPYLKPQLCSLWSQGLSNCWASSLQRHVSWEPVPWGAAKRVGVLTLWFSVTSWQLEIPTWLHGFPGGAEGKASACSAGDPGSIPGSGGCPGEGNGNPFQLLFPGESHGWRRLVGYSPWGHKESDTTEWLHSLTLRIACKFRSEKSLCAESLLFQRNKEVNSEKQRGEG